MTDKKLVDGIKTVRNNIFRKTFKTSDAWFIIGILGIIAYCSFYFFPASYFFSLSEKYIDLPNLVSASPALAGGLLIALWFVIRGKSIKNLNDFILFFFASYAIYLFIYDYQTSQELNKIEYIAENKTHLVIRVVLLVSSLAKTMITFIEFWREIVLEKQSVINKLDNQEVHDKKPSDDSRDIKTIPEVAEVAEVAEVNKDMKVDVPKKENNNNHRLTVIITIIACSLLTCFPFIYYYFPIFINHFFHH
ncbi:hypothetical protein C1N58_03735 [Pantoea sp. SGAir0180]